MSYDRTHTLDRHACHCPNFPFSLKASDAVQPGNEVQKTLRRDRNYYILRVLQNQRELLREFSGNDWLKSIAGDH